MHAQAQLLHLKLVAIDKHERAHAEAASFAINRSIALSVEDDDDKLVIIVVLAAVAVTAASSTATVLEERDAGGEQVLGSAEDHRSTALEHYEQYLRWA